MKKIVSLFLTCLLVLSIGMIPAFATTETLTVCSTAEEDLTVDEGLPKAPAASPGYCGTNETVAAYKVKTGVTVREDSTGNKYFEIAADTTSSTKYYEHMLAILSNTNHTANKTLKRFTAKIQLPSTTGSSYVFGQLDVSSVSGTSRIMSGFGVRLTGGQAQYYDATTSTFVNFLESGKSIEASKWYTIEAVMDARGVDDAEKKVYMNAFVYDEQGDIIGQSGWQLVAQSGGKWGKVWYTTNITAANYEEGTKVLVDEFKEYVLADVPTYTVVDKNFTTTTTYTDNKYISATTSSVWYIKVGERFNLKTTSNLNYLGDGSANTAARYNMSFRIPVFGISYNFIDFISGRNMDISKTMDGAVQVDATGLFSAKSVDGTAVNLTEGTTYQLTADTWYNLELLVDYSTFATPQATLILKDATGNVLTRSAQYTVDEIPVLTTSTLAQSSLMWVGFGSTGKYIHFDNTKVDIAPTYAELIANTNITTVIDDDFEVYEGENVSYYAEGQKYSELVGALHVYHSDGNVTNINNAIVAQEKVEHTTHSGFDFEEGMTLPTTEPLTLKFTYSNDVPNANINADNVKLVAGTTELVGGVDYTVTANNDGTIADTSKSFTVAMLKLVGDTTYAIRLMRGLSDYNTSAASNGGKLGLPLVYADYKEITFTTPEGEPTTIVSSLVDNENAAVVALAKDAVIKGKVDIENNDADAINGYVILGIYDGDQLVTALISENAFSAASGATISASTPTYTVAKDGLKAKVFVWKDLTSIQPIIAAEVVPAE
ncbi:MAG: hypothetical protein II978_04210 [Clostridia bacterium]|nr:hypothetical protein [Clostridia bacterium]